MKNPFMSMWLSAMNTAAGQMQGLWMAELTRQQNAYMREFYKMLGGTSISGLDPKPKSGARSPSGRRS
jgi:hypothetical protein